jgi:hypothetical protein
MISALSPEKIADLTEVVICDSEAAMEAHKDLFRFSQNAYLPVYETNNNQKGNSCDTFPAVTKLIETCNLAPLCPSRIHLVAGWDNILKVAAWKAELTSVRDALIILKNAGIAESDLTPFAGSPVSDLFPYLYYGKRLNVIKKICMMARKQIESHLKKGGVRADCHMIAEDAPRIFASSL